MYNTGMTDTTTFDASSFKPLVPDSAIPETTIILATILTSDKVKETVMKYFFGISVDEIDELSMRQASDLFVANVIMMTMEDLNLSVDEMGKVIRIPMKYKMAFQQSIKALKGTPTSDDLNEQFGFEG